MYKAIAGRLDKLIYIIVVIWAFGIGPLVYIERFSSHREVQNFQISILGQTAGRSSRLPPELIAALERFRQPPELILWSKIRQETAYYTTPGRTSSTLLSALTGGELLLSGAVKLPPDIPWGSRVLTPAVAGCSAWLPPPEKPPSASASGTNCIRQPQPLPTL